MSYQNREPQKGKKIYEVIWTLICQQQEEKKYMKRGSNSNNVLCGYF